MGDKSGRDQQTKPFEFRPGVGGFPAYGGMDRSRDPAGIAPNKAHLLINVRRKEGGWVSRGGQIKLFPDRLHPENVGEGDEPLWDEATGIGAITGIDPGTDETRYGARVLFCLAADGLTLSTWDGVVQRDYDFNAANGTGETGLPIPMFDSANAAQWGYRTLYDFDGVTPLYYVICRMSNVNNVFGVSAVFSTPKLDPWGGSVPNAGIQRRIAWSPTDSAYYSITENGLVISFTEDGEVTQEEDNSLDTQTTVTVYGVPVIFAIDDQVVILIGYGNGTSEPTTMQPPLCYVKNLFSGAWAVDNSITDNFVPLTRPVFHAGEIYIGGYVQTTDSSDEKNGAVLIWQGGLGWAYMVGPLTGNSPVRGLCTLGKICYYVYDDVVNVPNSILGRFVSPTVGYDETWKLFWSQLPTVFQPCDGLFAYRGSLYARLYRSDVPYDGEGHLYKSNGADTAANWTRLGPDGIDVSGDPLQQVLKGAPSFVG